VRVWLIDYNRQLERSSDPGMLEEDATWELIKPELSFALWKLGKRFDWQLPLFGGGLVDWPDWFLHDLAILEWLNRMIRRDMGLDKS